MTTSLRIWTRPALVAVLLGVALVATPAHAAPKDAGGGGGASTPWAGTCELYWPPGAVGVNCSPGTVPADKRLIIEDVSLSCGNDEGVNIVSVYYATWLDGNVFLNFVPLQSIAPATFGDQVQAAHLSAHTTSDPGSTINFGAGRIGMTGESQCNATIQGTLVSP